MKKGLAFLLVMVLLVGCGTTVVEVNDSNEEAVVLESDDEGPVANNNSDLTQNDKEEISKEQIVQLNESDANSETEVSAPPEVTVPSIEEILKSIDINNAILGTWKGEVERLNGYVNQIEITFTEDRFVYNVHAEFYSGAEKKIIDYAVKGTFQISNDLLKCTPDSGSEGENPPIYKISYDVENDQLLLIGGGARLANVTTGGILTSNTYDTHQDGVAESWDAYFKYKDPDTEKKDDKATPDKVEPMIGMDSEQVLASTWGEPVEKNVTTYAWGSTEQWVYSNYRYIYFRNGRVTAITDHN